jgi:hypothetical protein
MRLGMRRLQVVLIASVLAVPCGTFAQSLSVSADDGAQIPKPSFSIAGSPLRDGVNKEAARLAKTLAPVSQPQGTEHKRNWAGRHPVLLGTLIGLGVGLAYNATQCGAGSDFTCAQLAALFGGLGAGIGAGAGGAVAIALR